MRKLIYFLIAASLFACKKESKIAPVTPQDTGLPKVSVAAVSNLTRYSVTVTGAVIDTGAANVTEAGFVVDTLPNPTVTQNLNKFVSTINTGGQLLVVITNIPASKKYYIRTYARNKKGVAYGSELNFSSKPEKIYTGNAELNSQQQIIDFGKEHYTKIAGALRISGPVTDLTPLSSIAAVNGDLYIGNTTALQTLKGLDSLEMPDLTSYTGIRIENNSALTTLDGLEHIIGCNGYLYILNNKVLKTMKGLDRLKYITAGELRIEGCDQLTSLSGLESLTYADEDVTIKDEPSLIDITGLRNLSTLGGDLTFQNNASLQRLDGLENVTDPEGVNLTDNPKLTDLKGLGNITTLRYLTISGNNGATNLSAFGKVKTIEIVNIEYNSVLTDLSGLNLEKITSSLQIQYNTALTSLKGLESTTDLSRLAIFSNPNLKSISGLSGLKRLVGPAASLVITFNDQLTNLDGLQQLTYVGGEIQFDANKSLTNYCGLAPLFNTGWSGSFAVIDNAYNPTVSDVISKCK